MTPTTDDNGRWLEAAGALIAALWAALGALYWRLWKTLATREWVLNSIKAVIDADDVRDRLLFNDLTGKLEERLRNLEQKTEERHAENIARADRNSEKLDAILTVLRGRTR